MPGIETKSTSIDGVEFVTTQFDAFTALEVLAKLAKVAGPLLSMLGGMNPDTPLSSIGPQLAQAFQGLKPSEASDLVLDLLKQTQAIMRDKTGALRVVELNTKDRINQVFSGRLKLMFQAVGHSIGANFGDFTAGSDASAPAPATAELS